LGATKIDATLVEANVRDGAGASGAAVSPLVG
jgi:hypothetical protein